jgi:eukaryotic-like serine/threonine-protein kinase
VGRSAAQVRVGGYLLVEVLGEGGMGVVYRAEQTEPVRRDVALKLLKPGLDSERVIARFELERHTLARMEHPGIASVLDAGVTAEGRPYFVMELVRGTPIVDYCDTHRLRIRDRLRLFADVCRAVQHAHQKGIIHRDIKPSNILIAETDGRPQCKVIDFGVARAVDTLADEPQLTRTQELVGTPIYMSPEQVLDGSQVDTRSDIYSLGVVLYELMVGALPFEPQAYVGFAAFAAVLARDTPPPATRLGQLGQRATDTAHARSTDVAGLARELHGDVQWIVLKALERERERRYASASDLAADLERSLANEPIAARPPAATYRMRKFVRRHPAGTSFAVMLIVLLVSVAVLQTVQTRRIGLARDDARQRRDQAEDLLGFMVGDLRTKLSPLGRLDVLDDVGRRAMAYFDAVPEDRLSDEERFRRAQMLSQIGQIRVAQGAHDEAAALFRQALEVATVATASQPERSEWFAELGATHFWIGNVHRLEGRLEEALAEFEAYRGVAEELVRRDPARLDWQQELASGHANVGAIAYQRGDLEAAAQAFRSRVAVQQHLIAGDTANLQRRHDLANVHNFLGAILEDSGDLTGALEQYRADVSLRRTLLVLEPDNMPWQQRLAVGLSYLGGLHSALGQADSAVLRYREGLDVESGLVRHDPANNTWRRSHATAAARLGRARMAQGDVTLAAPLLRDARTTMEELLRTNPTQRGWQIDLAFRFNDEAVLALARGDAAAALDFTRRAHSTLEPALASQPGDRTALRAQALVHSERGRAWRAAGAPDSAAASWSRAVAVLEPITTDTRDWRILEAWVRALVLAGQIERAAPAVTTLDAIGFREPSLRSLLASADRE